MEVLFNADDFGLTKSITDGIIRSHTNGIVRSTTLMMNGLAVPHAIEQAKQHPDLHVGIHLVLTWGRPLHPQVYELVGEDGTFKYTSIMNMPVDSEAVKREWTAQIEAFLETGLPLHHIDSHHHVHGWEPLRDVVVYLAKTYNVPVRFMPSLKQYPEILLTDMLWDGFYADGVNRDIFSQLKQTQANRVEVMTHPAYVDDALRQVSSYVEKRAEELQILTSIPVPSWATLL